MTRKKKNAQQQKHLVVTADIQVDDTLEDLFAQRHNKYLLVNVIARRSRDLNRGSRALVQLPHPHTFTETAKAEVEQGLMKLERRAKTKVLVNLIDNE